MEHCRRAAEIGHSRRSNPNLASQECRRFSLGTYHFSKLCTEKDGSPSPHWSVITTPAVKADFHAFKFLDQQAVNPYLNAFLVHTPQEDTLIEISWAVLVYNLALTHHLKGIQSNDKSNLSKSAQLYKLSWNFMNQIPVKNESSVQHCPLLVLAAVNNIGHINAMLGNDSGVAACAVHIQHLLKELATSPFSHPPDWAEQLRFFATMLLQVSFWHRSRVAAAA
jgi:hypothetical protein